MGKFDWKQFDAAVAGYYDQQQRRPIRVAGFETNWWLTPGVTGSNYFAPSPSFSNAYNF